MASKRPLLAYAAELKDEVAATETPKKRRKDHSEGKQRLDRVSDPRLDDRFISNPKDVEALEIAVFGNNFKRERHNDDIDVQSDNQVVDRPLSDDDDSDSENNKNKVVVKKEEGEESKLTESFVGAALSDVSDSESENSDDDRCVWRDEDDSSLTVDLNSHVKMRKLKKGGHDAAVVVSATEYQKRLKQFHLQRRNNVAKGWLESVKEHRARTEVDVSSSEEEEGSEERTKGKSDRPIRLRTPAFLGVSAPVLRKKGNASLQSSRLSYKVLPDANKHGPSK